MTRVGVQSSLDSIQVIKSAMRYVGTRRMDTKFWWRILNETDHTEDLGIDGRIIFKCILKTDDGGSWVNLTRE